MYHLAVVVTLPLYHGVHHWYHTQVLQLFCLFKHWSAENLCAPPWGGGTPYHTSAYHWTIPPQGTTIVVSPTASINDISNGNVQVSPNPFNESIVVLNKSNSESLSFKLMDARGKLTLSGSTNGDAYMISTSELSSGVYFLTLINEANQAQLIYKLVK